MTSSSSSRLPAERSVRLVLAVLLAVFVASAVRNIKEEGDFRGYLEVGELLLRGGDIYADARPDVNTWPPLFSVVCVPFALLARVSVYLARGVWLLLNAGLIVGLLQMTIRLTYGRPLTLGAGGISLASAAVLGPLVLSSRFFLGNLDRLQINVFILFCSVAGCLLLARGRPGTGGAVIGVAAAIKVLPVFFVPYFAWKRWWAALAGTLTAGVTCSLLPIVVFGPTVYWTYVQRWLEIASGGWPVRKGNQSVYAMVDRLYTHGAVFWSPAHMRLTASGDPMVAAAVYGLLLVVVVLSLHVTRRGGRDPAGAAAITEYALVLCVAVLFSPLAWKHYFVFLWPGYVALWRMAFNAETDAAIGVGRLATVPEWPVVPATARRRLVYLVTASFVLTTLSVRGVVGKEASLTLETLSAVTLGALLVLGALLYVRAVLGTGETEE